MTVLTTLLKCKVSPKASRNAITGWHADHLKLSVTAVPEKGKANAAVSVLLAEALGLPRSAVSVVAGHTQSVKRLRIDGLDEPSLRARLDALIAGDA